MPRYIDADKLLQQIDSRVPATYFEERRVKNLCTQLTENAPTADVVPRSEVEQLQRNLEQCENGYKQHIHLMECKHKDEVEGLKKENEILSANNKTLALSRTRIEAEIEKAKQEVVREIFEEIETILSKYRKKYSVGGYKYHYFEANGVVPELAEFKKKYIGGDKK